LCCSWKCYNGDLDKPGTEKKNRCSFWKNDLSFDRFVENTPLLRVDIFYLLVLSLAFAITFRAATP
jgi:hypothetical protein